jgi:hypothetical protein
MLARLLSPRSLWHALLALCIFEFVLLLVNAGCSSGAICYRNTDCPLGFDCDGGQCVRLVPGVSDSSGGSDAGGGAPSSTAGQ